MNLIEELGLEKCKQIVEGAPAIANFYIPSKAGYTRMGECLAGWRNKSQRPPHRNC